MKTLFFLFCMLLTQLVSATDSPKGLKASGKVDIYVANIATIENPRTLFLYNSWTLYLKTNYIHHNYEKININLKYSFWGENKIRGEIVIPKTKRCPIENTITFYGVDNGFSEFQIFESIDHLAKLVHPIGTIVNYGSSISIILNRDKFFTGISKKLFPERKHYDNNICLRGFEKNSALNIKIQK